MDSSYKINGYDEVFKCVVNAFKPTLCVELGVLNGYSTLAIASGLKNSSNSILHAYDIFEDYVYKHSNYDDIKALFSHCKKIKVIKQNAYKVHENYEDKTVDLLHVDLSNTGETLRKIIELWDCKLKSGSIILFEGGSEERDKVEWMLKYGKSSIRAELEYNPIINARYIHSTYQKFPSLTMLVKK